MKKFVSLVAASAWALPLLAAAQTRVTSITSAAGLITNIINDVLVPLVFAVAFVTFIWGVFRFFIAGTEDEKAKENAKHLMLYGIIGFFVMVSVWGLVNILLGTVNLNSNVPTLPSPPGPR